MFFSLILNQNLAQSSSKSVISFDYNITFQFSSRLYVFWHGNINKYVTSVQHWRIFNAICITPSVKYSLTFYISDKLKWLYCVHRCAYWSFFSVKSLGKTIAKKVSKYHLCFFQSINNRHWGSTCWNIDGKLFALFTQSSSQFLW